MGRLWENDGSDYVWVSSGEASGIYGPADNSNSDRCATRKVVRSQCHTEEVEPGVFVRKCEKTEQIFKDCVGRPSEMVQSNKEYTEEDVTDQMVKGSSFPSESEHRPIYFPGLRNDIEAIERSFFSGINRFFEAAEEMKNDFFNSVGAPHIFDEDSSSRKHGIHVERAPPEKSTPERNSDGYVDLSGIAKDV